MTPKQRVLKRYPKARAEFACGKRDRWVVYTGNKEDFCIGVGPSPRGAWADARYFIQRYGG